MLTPENDPGSLYSPDEGYFGRVQENLGLANALGQNADGGLRNWEDPGHLPLASAFVTSSVVSEHKNSKKPSPDPPLR